jgi:HEPN domain-containing protein
MKSYRQLPPEAQSRLKPLIDKIVKVSHPEKIILFGLHAGTSGTSHHTDLHPTLKFYDLLVIVGDTGAREGFEIQDIIESSCKPLAPTTVIVHDIEYVNSRLQEGNFFFYEIHQNGVLLYDAKTSPLARPSTPNLDYVWSLANYEFTQWSRQARVFYEAALFAKQLHHNRISIFLLHQATEQMYQAIILTHTGFKPTTHNIDKLRRYTIRLSIDLALIFPKDSAEETRLFNLLVASYIGGRYKTDFSVSDEDLGLLISRAEQLISTGEKLCILRLQFLDTLNSSNSSF